MHGLWTLLRICRERMQIRNILKCKILKGLNYFRLGNYRYSTIDIWIYYLSNCWRCLLNTGYGSCREPGAFRWMMRYIYNYLLFIPNWPNFSTLTLCTSCLLVNMLLTAEKKNRLTQIISHNTTNHQVGKETRCIWQMRVATPLWTKRCVIYRRHEKDLALLITHSVIYSWW